VEDIERVIGKLIINTENEISPEAPGMLSKHYAPLTKTILTNDVNEVSKKYSGKRIGLLLFAKKIIGADAIHQEILSSESKLEQATSNLYTALHRLDSYKLDVIIAERFPDIGLGKTILKIIYSYFQLQRFLIWQYTNYSKSFQIILTLI
jgi:L-threonylcarbamoyladenylate synthase